MTSAAYRKCLMLVDEMVKQRFFPQVNEAMVKRLIALHIGADQRTLNKYVKLLVDFDFLFKHKERAGVPVYRLNMKKLDVKQLTLADVKEEVRE